MVRFMLYPCIFWVDLPMNLFGFCVACLTVFGEIIHNNFRCGCYFLSSVGRCSVGYIVYGLPKSVCDVPVIPMCI